MLLLPLHRHQPLPILAALLAAACMDAAGEDPLARQAATLQPEALQGAEVVVEWNALAHEIAYAEDRFLTFKGQRALAMMNLAMHDALNTISPKYERYVFHGGSRAADAERAAAHAAHGVLAAQYPARMAQLDSLLDAHRKQSGSPSHAAAADLGLAVADAVLRARMNDGWDNAGSYDFGDGAGAYQSTPDWNGFVLQPGFRYAKPFALRAPQAFRPPPPPPLPSTAYARAFDEVRRYGSIGSAERTSDQSAYGIWWMEFAEGSMNRLARRLVAERSIDLWSAARLFAHLHMALYDGYIATWDAKYEYNHWRPFTAVRASDDDNRSTRTDLEWQSLLPAPPFPEYVSAHATACAASSAVLASLFQDTTSFTMTTTTAPPEMPERSFRSFSAAAAECADSRIMLGWHFRYSTDAGLELGRRVANFVLRTQLRQR